MKKTLPIMGASCMALSSIAILMPVATGPDLGGQINVHLRGIAPFVFGALIILSFIRRERVVWSVIGIVLTAFYVGLHFVAIP